MKHADNNSRKVAIVGLEQITATNVYSLLVSGRVQEIVLVGDQVRNIISGLRELQAVVTLRSPANVKKGYVDDCTDAAVTVITVSGKTGEEVREYFAYLENAGFSGVYLLTGGSLDVLLPDIVSLCGLIPSRIFGLGHVAPKSQTQQATWCTALNSDVTHIDSCTSDCPYFETMLESSGIAAHGKAGRSPERLAACVTQICEAVVDDLHTVLPVVTIDDGVVTELPCVIGRSGIQQILRLPDEPIENEESNRPRPYERSVRAGL